MPALAARPSAVNLGAMQLATYVNYRGNCEEAFAFYASHLGGRPGMLVRHAQMGHEAQLPEGWGGKIAHARIEIGGAVLMGADVPTAEPMRSAYLTLTLPDAAEAERVYAALTDGGEVFVPIAETAWSSRFAMLRDRFGASWMLMVQPSDG